MFCMFSVSIFSSLPIEMTFPLVACLTNSRFSPAMRCMMLLTMAPAVFSMAMKTPAFLVTRSSVIIVCMKDFSGNSARWKTDRPTKPKADDV